MPAKQRVAICIPSGESWKAPMAFQATCLAICSAPHVEVVPVNVRGEDTAQGRNRLVRLALEARADWLLWIDADMVFPPEALLQLLAHDLDIVGADYRLRAPPFKRIGLFLHDEDQVRHSRVLRAQAQLQQTGLVEMAMLGLGFILVRAAVFKKLPAPWFGRTWVKEHATLDNPDGFSTEDTYFCNCARISGYPIWCDLDLSAKVQHIGEAVVPWRLGGAAEAARPAGALEAVA